MIDTIRGIDLDLALDVTGLQSLSSPSGQDTELGQLGGHGGRGNNTCAITVTCCQTCSVTVCVGTIW